MRTLRYAINVTLDGCTDHLAVVPDDELHDWWTANLARAGALLFGRVTFEMMQDAWREPASGTWPEWMDDAHIAFARTIGAAKKYVVSSTLTEVGWNTEVLHGDLATAVRRLKAGPGGDISLGGVTLPRALADLGLIDEYEFVVHPVVAGHGPSLFAGLRTPLDLELVDRQELRSGAVVQRYRPRTAGH